MQKLAAELPVKYPRGSVGGSASCSLFPAPRRRMVALYLYYQEQVQGTVSVMNMMIKSTENKSLLPQLWVLVS